MPGRGEQTTNLQLVGGRLGVKRHLFGALFWLFLFLLIVDCASCSRRLTFPCSQLNTPPHDLTDIDPRPQAGGTLEHLDANFLIVFCFRLMTFHSCILLTGGKHWAVPKLENRHAALPGAFQYSNHSRLVQTVMTEKKTISL